MPRSVVRILVVGYTSPSTLATLERLEREGCGFLSVNTITEAETMLKTIRFDLILADEIIGEGRGYDLTDSVQELEGTLLVSVALSEASLWLPVVQRGKLTLGNRALNSAMLQLEITDALSKPVGAETMTWPGEMSALISADASRESNSAAGGSAGLDQRREQRELDHPQPKRLVPPRRKPAAAGAVSLTDHAELQRESAKTATGTLGGIPGRHFR